MKKMQNLIVISFDISSRNGDGYDSEDTALGQIKSEVDTLIEIALQYINQHERVFLKNANGAEIFYLGSAKEAMLMAIEFRDCMVAKNISSPLCLYLRAGIHLEKIDATDNNQVAPVIIRNASQLAKFLKNNAKLNEILVSRNYFENAAKSIQSIATVYDLPGPSDEAGIHNLDIISDNVKKPRVRKAEYAPVLILKNQDKPTLSQFETSLVLKNLNPEKKASSHFLKRLNWFFIAASVSVCLIFFLLSASHLTKLDLTRSANNTLKESATEQVSVDESKVNLPRQNLLPVTNERTTDKSNQQISDKAKKTVVTQPKADQKTLWNKLVNSVKQGKKSECSQAEIALKQCPK